MDTSTSPKVKRRKPTHCKRGHPRTTDNVRVDCNGSSSCRICEKLRSQKPEVKAQQAIYKKRYANTFEAKMRSRLRYKGLDPEEEQKAALAFANFDGSCQCCGSRTAGKRGWHLDHIGTKFRGVLCNYCNTGAAMLRDSIENCLKLAQYLKKFEDSQVCQ